jgi:hypothetical protein
MDSFLRVIGYNFFLKHFLSLFKILLIIAGGVYKALSFGPIISTILIIGRSLKQEEITPLGSEIGVVTLQFLFKVNMIL